MTATARPETASAYDWRAVPERNITLAQHGVVASANPLVSQVGVNIMRQGGNAVDASIAAGAVLMLVQPQSGHLGGDAFYLISPPDTGGKVIALNGSGVAPRAATVEHYRNLGGIPQHGIFAATVPGVIDCWAKAHALFGSLPFSDLFAPAIEIAEQGVPVTPRMHEFLASERDMFLANPETARVFAPGGEIPAAGDVLRQRDVAETLRRLSRDGLDDFYRGELAGEMVSYSEQIGGLFSDEDFAQHQTEQLDPLSIDYRGYTVIEQPLVTQGIIVLLALNTLQQFDLRGYGHATADTEHLLIEALKLAFEDRFRYLGDPAWVDVPLNWLLSEEHAKEQAAQIDMRHARPVTMPRVVQPDTTYMCLADGSGMMVSYIHSLYAGCGVVMGRTGVYMNNRLYGFTLEDGHPNQVAGGKRPIHTLNQYQVQQDGQTILEGGTPGAHWQVQTNLQILTNILDFGMDVQTAIEAPRFQLGDQMDITAAPLKLESRFSDDVTADLRERGHELEVFGPWAAAGTVQLISRNPVTGMYQGATEPRRAASTVLGY